MLGILGLSEKDREELMRWADAVVTVNLLELVTSKNVDPRIKDNAKLVLLAKIDNFEKEQQELWQLRQIVKVKP